MTEKSIRYIKQEHVATIIFKEKGGLETNRELAEICTAINGDEDIYVVIISATGAFFRDAVELSQPPENKALDIRPAEAVGAINRPTIAALNGDAFGVGLEIALACDMRIAVEGARFALPQIKNGRIPADGGTQRLARLVGKGKALEMILTGDPLDAVEALEIGLVNRVVKADSLTSEVEALAAALVTKAPLAMRYCKEAVNQGLDMTLEQGLRLEADLYFLLHTTSDRTEGVQSYLQKRKPEYKGK